MGLIMQMSEKEWQELKEKERLLNKALTILRVEPKDLPRVVQRFLGEVKEMKKQLKKSNSTKP